MSLGDIFEVLDAIFREENDMLAHFGRWKVVIGAEAAIFRKHFDKALVQEVFVFTKHFSDVFQRVQGVIAISYSLRHRTFHREL